MKKLSVLLAGLLSAGLAHASLVTYNYTVSIASLTEWHPAIGDTKVTSTDYHGFTITVGDIMHGSFTIDTTTPLLSSTPSGSGTSNTYNAAAGQNAITAIYNSSAYTINSADEGASTILGTENHAPGQGKDSLYIGTVRPLGTGGDESFGMEFSDPSGTALADNHLPGSLSGFTGGIFHSSFTTGQAPHALGLWVDGNVTSFAQVSAVPEPAPYVMLAAGLGLLAWRRRFYASNSA
jgi:hypothetical protein